MLKVSRGNGAKIEMEMWAEAEMHRSRSSGFVVMVGGLINKASENQFWGLNRYQIIYRRTLLMKVATCYVS